ncbi:MAG: esterase-like activity of phytase family protein [Candidatus Contendobacter sp.]
MPTSCLLWLLTLLLGLPVSGCAAQPFTATPITLHDQSGHPGDAYGGIRLLGALRLADATLNGVRLCGLSGLAWDEGAGLLYAVSDRGALFHLRPEFNAQGYLNGMQALAAYPLRDASGAVLGAAFRDAEGLTLRPDPRAPSTTELLISFEGKPRVARYSPKGVWRGEETLPTVLSTARNYRHSNQGLEAIALTPRWGMVLGTEVPLRADPKGLLRLFAMDGRFWQYPLGSAPGSALVAMEALADGSLLLLERAFVNPLHPLIISLRRTEALSTPGMQLLQVTDVVTFDSTQGWLLDNFEGLTHYRDQRFFMVSDDNCKTWQSTLLLYFELKASSAGSPSP